MIAKLGRAKGGLVDHKATFKRGSDCRMKFPTRRAPDAMRHREMASLAGRHIFFGMGVAGGYYIRFVIFVDLAQNVWNDRNSLRTSKRAVNEIGLHINYK